MFHRLLNSNAEVFFLHNVAFSFNSGVEFLSFFRDWIIKIVQTYKTTVVHYSIKVVDVLLGDVNCIRERKTSFWMHLNQSQKIDEI